ncbi:MAG: pyridoxal-dependent decarboxylase, partial [Catalinimonas sp.]
MSLLHDAYDPETFRAQGHRLIDQLADFLTATQHGEGPAIPWQEPDDAYAFWEAFAAGPSGPDELFGEVLARSVRLHHPRYVGHQVGMPAPVTALAGLVSSLLNNGAAVWEMGMAATAM